MALINIRQIAGIPNNIQETIDGLQKQVSQLNEQETSQSVLDCYPVGAIFTSVNDKNPSDIFGGKWKKISSGKVMLESENGESILSSLLVHFFVRLE